jgi:hypothetical protein
MAGISFFAERKMEHLAFDYVFGYRLEFKGPSYSPIAQW